MSFGPICVLMTLGMACVLMVVFHMLSRQAALQETLLVDTDADGGAQLAITYPSRGYPSPAMRAERNAAMGDARIVRPLVSRVQKVLAGTARWTHALREQLAGLTLPQLNLLTTLAASPLRTARRTLAPPAHAAPWVHVGSVRTQPASGALADVRLAPLHVQKHRDGGRRYNYRIQFADGKGGQAWVDVGDAEAQEQGLRWIRHGASIHVLDQAWQVYLSPTWRHRVMM